MMQSKPESVVVVRKVEVEVVGLEVVATDVVLEVMPVALVVLVATSA